MGDREVLDIPLLQSQESMETRETLETLKTHVAPREIQTGNIMELKTVQSVAFKTLVEALKELLTDTCIEINETGLKIIAVDQTRIVLVHLKLDAAKFDHFHCQGRIIIGVNMLNLHKLI